MIHLKGLYTITKTNLLERLHKFEGGGERSGVHRSRRTSREGETPDEIRYYPSMERHLVSALPFLPFHQGFELMKNLQLANFTPLSKSC